MYLYEVLTSVPLFARANEGDILLKQLRFIDIPHDKINKNCNLIYRFYNYQKQKWNVKIQKKDLFSYTVSLLESYNITTRKDINWIINTKNGYFSLIKYCILNHYNPGINNYIDVYNKFEYNYNSKFPSITTL